MGYDDLDRAMLNAWELAYHRYRHEPLKLDRVLRRFGGSTYTRPLRSWSLVLRADDKRIADNNTQGLVHVDRELVRTCCAPVRIAYPGVSLDDAARLLGVNRTTVSRWASPADRSWWREVRGQMEQAGDDPRFGRPTVYRVLGRRLILEHEVNRANRKRSTTRVWTPGIDGIDPGGEVWTSAWGRLRLGLADRVADGFVQQLTRVDRKIGGVSRCSYHDKQLKSRVMQWVCPPGEGGCGSLVYKVFLPMPRWTLMKALGGGRLGAEPSAQPSAEAGWARGFLCLRCAGLVYESAERTSSPGFRRGGGRRRVDAWDRFIKRISGGVLGSGDVPCAEEYLD